MFSEVVFLICQVLIKFSVVAKLNISMADRNTNIWLFRRETEEVTYGYLVGLVSFLAFDRYMINVKCTIGESVS